MESESAARNPYRLTRPVFDLIPGGRVDTRDLESDEFAERLRKIEDQNAEILQILGRGDLRTTQEVLPLKPLWYLFWLCQIIGLASLLMAEIGLSTIKGDLKFLGLGLTFIALEAAFLAKFAEGQIAKHGKEKTR